MASSSTTKKHIIILGAGVTGLQTALSLLQTNMYTVTIIAAHFPGDLSIDYTSPWAGGVWRSHALCRPEDAEVRDWDKMTYESWQELLKIAREKKEVENEKLKGTAADTVEKEIGLGIRPAVLLWSQGANNEETIPDGSGLWWGNSVNDFGVLDEKARSDFRVQDGDGRIVSVVFGAKYEAICINIPQYLLYLRQQVEARSGNFVRGKIETSQGVEGVVRGIKKSVAEAEAIHAVVLAAGLSSRHFLPEDEASKLFPIRGQTVLVKGEVPVAITHLFKAGATEEVTYIIPRPGSGTTILGGCKQKGNWSAEEDTLLTERILDRARQLAPALLKQGIDKGQNERHDFEIISIQIGRRPGRVGGPRVELGGVVDGMKLIYAYGHSGAGYQNSVGSANKVVSLLNLSESDMK